MRVQTHRRSLVSPACEVRTLTRDVDSLWNASSQVFIRISHIKQLDVLAGQHGLQLGVGHH